MTTDTLAALYTDKLTVMQNYAYARLGNEDLAADIVHDVYLRVWQALCDGRDIDHLPGYTWRAVKLAIIDHKRRLSTQVRHVPLYYADEAPAASGVEHIHAADELRSLLDATYMSAEQAYAVQAYYLAEQPIEEIASDLDIRPGAVKGRVHRGLTQLRQAQEARAA